LTLSRIAALSSSLNSRAEIRAASLIIAAVTPCAPAALICDQSTPGSSVEPSPSWAKAVMNPRREAERSFTVRPSSVDFLV
jgi:hypothetical protein